MKRRYCEQQSISDFEAEADEYTLKALQGLIETIDGAPEKYTKTLERVRIFSKKLFAPYIRENNFDPK